MNKKKIQEYLDKYGDIPKDYTERFAHIMTALKIKDKDLGPIRTHIRNLLNRRWDRTDFVFYVVPKATPRARRAGKTGIFYVKDAKDNSQMFKAFIDEHGEDLGIITTPCRMYVDVFLPMPSGMNRYEKILSELKLIEAIGKPDWDNVGKTYGDMTQKYYVLDDALTTMGVVRKFYSALPRIEVRFEYLREYDCKYHKTKVESWGVYKEPYKDVEEKGYIV